jgi:Fe-S cluster assembly protein SufB
MVEKQVYESDTIILGDIVASPYKFGFRTDIETEEFPKGISLEIINKISDKKNEPEFKKISKKVFFYMAKNEKP